MDLTEKKIKKRIYRFLRHLIQPPNLGLKGNEDEERVLELEYQYFFEINADNPIYKVQIFNNLQVDTGFIFNSRPKCEFCGVSHTDDCDFAFANKTITLKDILRSTQSARPSLVFSVLFRQDDSHFNLRWLTNQRIQTINTISNELVNYE